MPFLTAFNFSAATIVADTDRARRDKKDVFVKSPVTPPTVTAAAALVPTLWLRTSAAASPIPTAPAPSPVLLPAASPVAPTPVNLNDARTRARSASWNMEVMAGAHFVDAARELRAFVARKWAARNSPISAGAGAATAATTVTLSASAPIARPSPLSDALDIDSAPVAPTSTPTSAAAVNPPQSYGGLYAHSEQLPTRRQYGGLPSAFVGPAAYSAMAAANVGLVKGLRAVAPLRALPASLARRPSTPPPAS